MPKSEFTTVYAGRPVDTHILKTVLEAAGLTIEPVGAEVDECAIEAEMSDAEPAEVAQALAAAKASARPFV